MDRKRATLLYMCVYERRGGGEGEEGGRREREGGREVERGD